MPKPGVKLVDVWCVCVHACMGLHVCVCVYVGGGGGGSTCVCTPIQMLNKTAGFKIHFVSI